MKVFVGDIGMRGGELSDDGLPSMRADTTQLARWMQRCLCRMWMINNQLKKMTHSIAEQRPVFPVLLMFTQYAYIKSGHGDKDTWIQNYVLLTKSNCHNLINLSKVEKNIELLFPRGASHVVVDLLYWNPSIIKVAGIWCF